MANNYTQFATVVECGTVEQRDTFLRIMQDERKDADGYEFYLCDAAPFQATQVFLKSEEGCDLESTFERIAEAQQAAGLSPFGFGWADFCDKSRPDEFGGGAVWFQHGKFECISTFQWLDEFQRQEGKVD